MFCASLLSCIVSVEKLSLNWCSFTSSVVFSLVLFFLPWVSLKIISLSCFFVCFVWLFYQFYYSESRSGFFVFNSSSTSLGFLNMWFDIFHQCWRNFTVSSNIASAPFFLSLSHLPGIPMYVEFSIWALHLYPIPLSLWASYWSYLLACVIIH